MVRTVTRRAQDIRPDWIEAILDRGIDVLEYLELVSVVSRLQAIDTYLAKETR